MRKRNYTVTIRMNKEEYDLLQNKVKESGQTQQAVVIHAIAGLKIASAEEVEELKTLNQILAEILSQLRGADHRIRGRRLPAVAGHTVRLLRQPRQQNRRVRAIGYQTANPVQPTGQSDTNGRRRL